MSNIIYIEEDLFNCDDKLLVHACNTEGAWGSGIAKQFKDFFHREYVMYNKYCRIYAPEDTIGSALVINKVGCLFTSTIDSRNPNSEKDILVNTERAIDDLLSKYSGEIAMNKINSGLFKVPWQKTEFILTNFSNKTFYVYTGEQK